MITHVFELSADLFFHKNTGILDVLVHILLYDRDSEHELWRRTKLPCLLPINKTGATVVSTQHTVYDIERGFDFVASNGQAAFPVSQSSLDDNQKMGRDFYCLYLLHRRHSIHDDCEVALYLNELNSINRLCRITVKTIPETAIAISNRETLIYSEKQTLEEICTALNGTKYKGTPEVEG